jgi:Rho-binding antiterminator
MSDYKPVSCELYAQFEHWIVRRQRLRVAWKDGAMPPHIESLQPLDLRTREHAEYLIARRHGGGRLELRLDRIVRAQPI